MNAPAHTPGPWRVNAILTASENDRGWNIARDHAGIGGFVGTVSPRIKGNRGNASAEGLANARLIAAAPELLEALIVLRGACAAAGWLTDPAYVQHMDGARAAIAKATRGDK
jgi:hypothetical protein